MSIQNAKEIAEIEVIKTGLFIDKLLGSGGIPKQRITEIVGMPGCGKSTLCLQIVSEAQKLGCRCLWVDAEGTFTPLYAQNLGVDIDRLDVSRGECGEDILNDAIEAIDKGGYDLIVIDSIGEATPRAVVEKEIGERSIGGQATIIGQFVRKAALKLPMRNVAVIGINQLRTDIMTGRVEGRGGASWNYHKAVSVNLKRKPGVVLKSGENVIGFVVQAEIREKNKMFGNVGFKMDVNFINNEGFSKSADLLASALDAKVITKTGNTYYFEGEKLGMISKVRELMKDADFSEKVKYALS